MAEPDRPAPPAVAPTSWTVGRNLRDPEAIEEAAEGPFEVRMTFSEVAPTREWLLWLMSIDPAWRMEPP